MAISPRPEATFESAKIPSGVHAAFAQKSGTKQGLAISGRILLAAPMILYSWTHFVYAPFVATFVPPWIPWHLFWAYFCGAALLAAGIAIVLNRVSRLAATLLGVMIAIFILTIHTRILAHLPGDAFANRAMFGDFSGRIINFLKDFGLCGAAFLFAGTSCARGWRDALRRGAETLTPARVRFNAGRIIVAIAILAFGVIHFIYPVYAPGIPPMYESARWPLPGQLPLAYITGAILVGGGLALAANQDASRVATVLACVILVFLVITWAPQVVAQPAQLISGNWLKDVGILGGVMILAAGSP